MSPLRDQAQDLYDALTCAGIRLDLWPPAPGDDDDYPGNKLEQAFVLISEYLTAVTVREHSERIAEMYPDSLPFRVRILRGMADSARYDDEREQFEREIALLRNGVA